ncbi:hypothetical protein [Pseudoalteromonas rubra]|uniref:hypothetical protein n=1 Tax=Pseudoalteromonas rubra TaxID=43658 RepID=UPI000F78D1EB|nr:hypothetical protein [Pseudoalteromonas rubra]
MIDAEMLLTLVAVVLIWPTLYVIIRIAANIKSIIINVYSGLRSKVDNCLSKEAQTVVAILLLGLSLTLLLMYTLGFFDKSFADSIELATIAINNFITPTLLALSVFLLFKTWSTSKEDLRETKDILRKKEELELLRSRIALLSKKLDSLPARQFSYWPRIALRELTKQHQVTDAIPLWQDSCHS